MAAPPEIEGVVEALTPQGEIHGWARAADGSPLGILVLRQGTVLAKGAPSVPRPDLGGPHGYVVTVSAPLQAIELLGGLAQVFATRPGRPPHRLPVVGGLLTGTLHALLEEASPYLTADEAGALVQRLRGHPVLRNRFLSPQPATHEAAATSAVLAALPPNPQRGAEGICQVGVPVGLVSPDGSIVAGHDGQLFLVEGSNGLAQQYQHSEDGALVQKAADGWHRVISARAAACAASGRGFLQLLIPDKASALAGLLPRAPNVPTPYWRALATRVAGDTGLQASVRFLLPQLAAPAAWPRTDTHLSAHGAHTVLTEACSAMGFPAPFTEARFEHTEIAPGDVADRLLPGHALLEGHAAPLPAQVQAWPAPELMEEVDPGRNIGRRLVWRTPAAPIRARVVVCGNSYFERGGGPRSISWWFARAFTEFHFCWLPELDEDYVRAVQPDWVVCQTVERFLPQVPAR